MKKEKETCYNSDDSVFNHLRGESEEIKCYNDECRYYEEGQPDKTNCKIRGKINIKSCPFFDDEKPKCEDVPMPKCANDLCECNNELFISGCRERNLEVLRECSIYNRLNPKAEYYTLRVPVDVDLTISYTNGYEKINNITLGYLEDGIKLESSIARGLKITCTKGE